MILSFFLDEKPKKIIKKPKNQKKTIKRKLNLGRHWWCFLDTQGVRGTTKLYFVIINATP